MKLKFFLGADEISSLVLGLTTQQCMPVYGVTFTRKRMGQKYEINFYDEEPMRCIVEEF